MSLSRLLACIQGSHEWRGKVLVLLGDATLYALDLHTSNTGATREGEANDTREGLTMLYILWHMQPKQDKEFSDTCTYDGVWNATGQLVLLLTHATESKTKDSLIHAHMMAFGTRPVNWFYSFPYIVLVFGMQPVNWFCLLTSMDGMLPMTWVQPVVYGVKGGPHRFQGWAGTRVLGPGALFPQNFNFPERGPIPVCRGRAVTRVSAQGCSLPLQQLVATELGMCIFSIYWPFLT